MRMYPYLLEDLFGKNIPSYSVMISVGIFFLLSIASVNWEKKNGFSHRDTNLLLLFLAIGLAAALFSSYLFDAVFHYLNGEEFAFESITFIGGLLGGAVTFIGLIWFGWKNHRSDLRKIMNSLIPGVVLAHAFGRIGCFLAGCCYGVPTQSFFGIVFPFGESAGVKVFPTQLFESIFLFILFFFLTKNQKIKGKEFPVYLISYGAFRFVLEFFRGDNRGSLYSFIHGTYADYPSPSQYLSILLLGIGVFLFMKKTSKPKNIAQDSINK
jgi:phosphatidylglycerol:prolipoprotein diacylglycerol transferase